MTDEITQHSIDMCKTLRWQQNCVQIMNAALDDADREIEKLRAEFFNRGMLDESARLLALRKRIVRSINLALEE